ncbi:hypothetical protein OIU77_011782 [Salix suchowensis]|uniref:Uncharacterized protein n=1 Tax=Salix suchowensis TaxID=1278906 RepID=A0ABQ9A1E0_9ROSI|nr:hypothetical protein OIU77_011782 [Salix suchowensis]
MPSSEIKLPSIFKYLNPGFCAATFAKTRAPDLPKELLLISTSFNWRWPSSKTLLIWIAPSSLSSFSAKFNFVRCCFSAIQAATIGAASAVMSFPAISRTFSEGADSLRALAIDIAPSSSKLR